MSKGEGGERGFPIWAENVITGQLERMGLGTSTKVKMKRSEGLVGHVDKSASLSSPCLSTPTGRDGPY